MHDRKLSLTNRERRCWAQIVMFSMFAIPHALGDPGPRALEIVTQPRVLVIAHRGASADFPENTLPAFQGAAAAGADLIELDYYHSQDAVPFVFHDKTLDRTTDAGQRLCRQEIPVDSLSWSDLQRLDAGAWFAERFAGTRIPTLRESLLVIQDKSTALIERKSGDAATCIQLLRELQLIDQVVVQAFDWDYLKSCHAEEPRLTLGALGDKELSPNRLQEAATAGAKVVGWKHEDLDAEAIARAHGKGFRVWAYTVNEEARAEQLIRDGIDGLITDRPQAMRSLIERRSAGEAR